MIRSRTSGRWLYTNSTGLLTVVMLVPLAERIGRSTARLPRAVGNGPETGTTRNARRAGRAHPATR
jgi:hypothetical protein